MSNYPHEWKQSTLGLAVAQCIHCFATNREIAAVGDINHCKERQKKLMSELKGEDNRNAAEATVTTFVNRYADALVAQVNNLAEQGAPKELLLSGLIYAVAILSHELGVPTVKTGMALAEARQHVDSRAPANMRPM